MFYDNVFYSKVFFEDFASSLYHKWWFTWIDFRCFFSASLHDQKIQHECVKCLKAFMNNKVGFNSFITEVVIIQKLVHWFAEQIHRLFSIW